MMRISIVLILALMAGVTSPALAYEPLTHREISRRAVLASILNNPATLGKLGLLSIQVDDGRQTFPRANDQSLLTITELIGFGSTWEDELFYTQALRHFYDPVKDRALDIPGAGQTLSQKSPDWALEDSQHISGQLFSYADAREIMYLALTYPASAFRKQAFGMVFQTLGACDSSLAGHGATPARAE